MDLNLVGIEVISRSEIRVEFSRPPLMANPTSLNDALNPANYSFAPGNAIISEITRTSSKSKIVTIKFASLLNSGNWTLTVSNIQTPQLNDIVTDTFDFTITNSNSPLSRGAETSDPERDITIHTNPTVFIGKGWDALRAALACGDNYVSELSKAVYKQSFIPTASSKYLDSLAANNGLTRNPILGLDDDSFRRLAQIYNSYHTVPSTINTVLETYFGIDATHAYAISDISEPFDLADGMKLAIKTQDGQTYECTLDEELFSNITEATAVEVAAALTQELIKLNAPAYSEAWTDPETGLTHVKIYSTVSGLGGTIQVLGGQAQNVLQFPTLIETTQDGGSDIDVITAIATTGGGGRVRFSWVSGTDPSFNLIKVGDYVNIYDSVFNSKNRGYFQIIKATTTYFEVINPIGVAQSVTLTDSTGMIFFSPQRKTINSNQHFAILNQYTSGLLDLVLPPISENVYRTPQTASYLRSNSNRNIASIGRTGTTVTVATSSNHGLSIGDRVRIQDVDHYESAPTNSWDYLSPNIDLSTDQAITLASGDILTCGGRDSLGTVGYKTSYLITPTDTSATIAQTTDMNDDRINHRAILLPNYFNKVLVTGGNIEGVVGLPTCEFYDEETATWTYTGYMVEGRSQHCIDLLPNGQVIVVGGSTSNKQYETFDPNTATWTAHSGPFYLQNGAKSVVLRDGRIVYIGGYEVTWPAETNVQIYNPSNNRWYKTAPLLTAVAHHSATLVNYGTSDKIVVVGGTTNGTDAINLVQIFDVATETWSYGPSTTGNQFGHAAIIGHDGNLLVTGGQDQSLFSTSVIKFYHLENRWEYQPVEFSDGVSFHSLILLPNKRYLNFGSFVSGQTAIWTTFTDIVMAGGFNGEQTVTQVTAANVFKYETPDYPLPTPIAGVSNASFTKLSATDDDIEGPYVFNTKSGLDITSISTTLDQVININANYKNIQVDDVTDFPNEEGWLVFGFGTSNQVGPVKYTGTILATNQLILDSSFIFPQSLTTGADITLLSSKMAPVPTTNIGLAYLTNPALARTEAISTIETLAAAGVDLNVIVKYPSDNGLGNETYPTSGNPKISDIVKIYGGDSVENEIEEARNDS